MVNRQRFFLMLLSGFLLTVSSFQHVFAQTNPVEACTEGVELSIEGDYMNALPLLSSGYASGNVDDFSTPNEYGICALAYGEILFEKRELELALEANQKALEIFQVTQTKGIQGKVYYNLGNIYSLQHQNTQARVHYEAALTIVREFVGIESVGMILNNLGDISHRQGLYAQAISQFDEALSIIPHSAGLFEQIAIKNERMKQV